MWKEVTGRTERKSFDPKREVIELKFETDIQNPLNEVADVAGEFMIRIRIQFHSDSTTNHGLLGNVEDAYKIKGGKITKTMEKLQVGDDAENVGCTQYDTFLKIAEQGRLPTHIKIDLLNDAIMTAERTYQTNHANINQCSALSEQWANLVTSGNIKFIDATFRDNNFDNIQKMGWRCYLKIGFKLKGECRSVWS